LHMAGEQEEALALLEESEALIKEEELKEETKPEAERWVSSVYLAKGHILEALDNRPLAAEAFQSALRQDIFCMEAFEALVQHQMLTAAEERDLLSRLPFMRGGEAGNLAECLYSVSLKKYSRPEELELPNQLESLKDNLDIQVCLAERHFYNCDYRAAYQITCRVIKADPWHASCLPVHIALMVELKVSNSLFQLAHSLVDLYPEWCVSWFAVGCYYYLTGRQDPARRYLQKATQLDRLFGPAWLAYGHSFAVENEHDQAMAAYFKACQLMRGCHLPLLYIGLEYSLTNNQQLAERFFKQALGIAPQDPFVLHELGVTAFHGGQYEVADKYLRDALLKVEAVSKSGSGGGMSCGLAEKWESLLSNLGHTYRKLGRYEEALSFHQQALVLRPLNPSTYSAIGYVQSLTGDLMGAVESFHKALGIRREDTFSTQMLNSVIEQLMSEVAPFPGYPEETPRFSPLKSPVGGLECREEVDGGDSFQCRSTSPEQGDNSREMGEVGEEESTLADTSNLSIDCEMEDTSKVDLDMDQTS